MRARYQHRRLGDVVRWQAVATAAAGRDKCLDLFTRKPLLAELTDIVGRRKFETKIIASGLSVDQLVDSYAALAAMVRPVTVPRIVRDPDDDHIIACAIAAQADAIVSGDRDLLDLGQHQDMAILSERRAAAHRLTLAGTDLDRFH